LCEELFGRMALSDDKRTKGSTDAKQSKSSKSVANVLMHNTGGSEVVMAGTIAAWYPRDEYGYVCRVFPGAVIPNLEHWKFEKPDVADDVASSLQERKWRDFKVQFSVLPNRDDRGVLRAKSVRLASDKLVETKSVASMIKRSLDKDSNDEPIEDNETARKPKKKKVKAEPVKVKAEPVTEVGEADVEPAVETKPTERELEVAEWAMRRAMTKIGKESGESEGTGTDLISKIKGTSKLLQAVTENIPEQKSWEKLVLDALRSHCKDSGRRVAALDGGTEEIVYRLQGAKEP